MKSNGYLTPAISRNGYNDQALEYTLLDLQRRFGPGAIMRLGDAAHLRVQVIATGFPAVDEALGVGGIPRGRVTDIYGPEASGKTTLCLHIIAQAQRQGGVAVFIDTEHALDPAYTRQCGVNIDELYLAQPATGEEALEIAEAMARARAAVVVIDSAAALSPRAEIEGEMGDEHAGLEARLMSQALRKLVGIIRRQQTALIFTNQLRQRLNQAGTPETPTGGMALRFYASVRIDLRCLKAVKARSEIIGTRIRATIQKNKVAAPFQVAEFDILYRA